MGKFLKNFGLGLVYIVLLPILLAILVLFAVYGLGVCIYLFFASMIRFFQGKEMFPMLPEDVKVAEIKKAQMDAQMGTPAPMAPQAASPAGPSTVYVQQNYYQGQKENDTDFFYLKNVVNNILQRLRIDIKKIEIKPSQVGFLQQGLQYINKDSKKPIAILGKVDLMTRKAFDIKQDVFFADINWKNVLKLIPKNEIQYENISKFPEVRRDLALVLDENVSFLDIELLAYETEKKILKKVSLFDEYKGDKLPQGKKQYAISFILQDENKTLNDKQIDNIMAKLLKTFQDKLNAQLR
jgi:phenylalanyl-tRNA synthetase beta subunit